MYHVAVHTRSSSVEKDDNSLIVSDATETKAVKWAEKIPHMIGYVGCDTIREAQKRTALMRISDPRAYGPENDLEP